MLPADPGSAPASPRSIEDQHGALTDAEEKISPLTFPVPSVSPEYVNSMASGLRTVGASISETGNGITGAWAGLRECYTAPESETLYAVVDPVATDGEEVCGALADAATALETFAEGVEGIKERWSNLRGEAYELLSRISAAGDDWRKAEGGWDRFVGNDSPLVQENADLVDKGAKIIESYTEIETACASAINGHLAGATRFESMPEGGAELDPNVFYHGYEQDLSELATEWGSAPAGTDHGWWVDAGAAVWDFGVGAVEGTGAMLGAHSSEGWFAQSWGDSLKEYHMDNIQSAAALVGLYDNESGEFGLASKDSVKGAWKDLAHSVVPWEEWGERPGYVIGTALLNIGATVGGAVLTATGVGAVVGVPLMAWRGAAILDGMGGSGRGGSDGGSGVDLPDIPDMPTFGGAGAPVVNVDASNFTPAQAAQVTASLDRLNASTSGGGGSSSSSESSSGGGGRSGQNASASNESSPNQAKKPSASQEDPDPSRDTHSESESVLPEQMKDGAEQPWESTPGNAEALNRNPSSTPSLAEQPRVVSTLTTEDVFNPVSPESTRLRDELGGDFKALDEQSSGGSGGFGDDAPAGRGPAENGSPSRGLAEGSKQLVGVGTRGNDGTLDQTANVPSPPLRNVDSTGIEPPGSNSGRSGNEIADNHGSGGNSANLQDRGPIATNQDGITNHSGNASASHSASAPGQMASASIRSDSDASSFRDGNNSGESHSVRGVSDLPERPSRNIGREGGIDLGDSSSGPKNAWDDPSRKLRDPDISKDPSPLEPIRFDSDRAPSRESPFDTKGLDPNKHYEVYDKSGRYRGIYSTGPDGKIVEIRTFPGESGSRNPDLGKPLPKVNYIIDSTKPGSDKKFVFQTDENSRTVRAYGELDLLDKADKKYRHNDQQSAAGNEGKDYFDDPTVDEGNSKSASLKDTFESVVWNGGHMIGTKFGGTGHSINLFAQMELTNKHQKGPDVPHVNFRDLEVALAGMLKDSNNRVDFEIECLFAEKSDVPTAIRVKALVNGKPPLLTTHRRDPGTGDLIQVQKKFPVLEYINLPPIKKANVTSVPDGSSVIGH